MDRDLRAALHRRARRAEEAGRGLKQFARIGVAVAPAFAFALAVACGTSDGGGTPSVDGGASDANTNDAVVASPFDAGAFSSDAAADAADANPANVDSGPAPAPPVGDPITGLALGDGWTDPRALAAPVNTIAWEDSSFISASGRRLYFGYWRADYDALTHGQVLLTGPTRPGSTRDNFEIYEATIDNGAWSVLHSTVNSGANAEAAEGVDDVEQTMAFIEFDGSPNQGDVYLSKKTNGTWGVAQKLPAPINTSCVEDNAALSADGLRLYFDSNRADAAGTTCKAGSGADARDIYVSTWNGSGWGAPVAVKGEPAMGTIHWQVYPRNDTAELYWAGFDATCGASSCIYRATKQVDGSYTGRTVVIKATPENLAQPGDAFAVGEVSITQDGHYMYFTYIGRTALDGGFDGGPGANVNIGVAHR